MATEPFILERTLDAPVATVWKALTELGQMKRWYFDLKEFRPEVGFEFEFSGGTPEKSYLHRCRILEVVPQKKLSHSWRYEGYPGSSVLTFELFPEGKMTRLRLTHAGLDSFPQDDPNFALASFTAGWTHIIGVSLKEFLQKNSTNDR